MDFSLARKKAQEVIDEEFKSDDITVIIDDRYTTEFSRGWIFAYNIKEYVEDPFYPDFIMHIHPIIIDRIDGSVNRIKDCSMKFANDSEIIDFYLKSKNLA